MSEGLKDFQGSEAEDCSYTRSREVRRPVGMGEEGDINSYISEKKLKPRSAWCSNVCVLDEGYGKRASSFLFLGQW